MDVVLDSTIGLPLPRRRSPGDDVGTALPPRFVIEVTSDEVRVLDGAGDDKVDCWPRGGVAAYIHSMDEVEVEVELRWPDGDRAGRILAETSPEAREVAELLASDTRVARGADRAGDATLRRLVTATLSDEGRMERQNAIADLSRLLGEGERPLVTAAAERGMSSGIVLLTDRRLLWCSIGRKQPLILPREEICAARCEAVARWTQLIIERSADRRVTLDGVDPQSAGEAIAGALTPEPVEPAPPDMLDVLLADEPDEEATALIGKQLERVRELLLDGERPAAFTLACRGTRLGALVVTDRRVLWASKKGEPIVIERERISGVQRSKRFTVISLELELHGGEKERFDAVEPPARAGLILTALERPAT